ncbi:AHH domain-containing protein [Chryseobacterium indoltheticum]|uniref:A nuclease family of the HNH/ENDO VII superfamily with conserved AHH n=1 Tax=Chryseobacterium indoltheticum TaxID=254 RepID=A0A381F4E7_9FLAO|nr:AHH domain-containing protein [Chryseobacterium indoltheticum]SIQ60526.1 A nuclease family of the HNH/ENDO VII superfamily with conserved AHH [Chryseobacterium indoltheticum]SUX41426.1 Uncharacterised protein [Chryseobacterium indoltheticum]
MAKEFEQAHHLIPIELITNEKVGKFIQKAIEGGFEFNGKINAKWLKQFSSKFEHLKNGVHASHPQYTKGVEDMIGSILLTSGKGIDEITESQAKMMLEKIASQVLKKIEENPTIKINELF